MVFSRNQSRFPFLEVPEKQKRETGLTVFCRLISTCIPLSHLPLKLLYRVIIGGAWCIHSAPRTTRKGILERRCTKRDNGITGLLDFIPPHGLPGTDSQEKLAGLFNSLSVCDHSDATLSDGVRS